MKGGRVSHSRCMCLASHGYGGLEAGRKADVDGMHAGQSDGGWSHVLRCRSTTECKVKTPASRCTTLGRVKLELVGLPGKASSQDTTTRLWVVVHAASCLHCMVLHGCMFQWLTSVTPPTYPSCHHLNRCWRCHLPPE